LEVYNWNQYVQAAIKGENSNQKNFFPNIVRRNISEDISKKLILILTEIFTIDYGNLEMQQQIQRNRTTTPKGKSVLQEKDKTKILEHYKDNTKPLI
ncbi:879_t:CDS:2, partial [Gigaspora margarita]